MVSLYLTLSHMKLKSQIEKVLKYLRKSPYRNDAGYGNTAAFLFFLLKHVKALLLFFLTSP